MQYNIFKHARNKKDTVPYNLFIRDQRICKEESKKEKAAMRQEILKGEFWKEFSIFKAEQRK